MKNKVSKFGALLFVSCTAMAMEQQIELTITEKNVQPQQELLKPSTIISPAIPKEQYELRCKKAENLEKTWEKAKQFNLLKKLFDGNAIKEVTTSMKNPNTKLNDPREKQLISKLVGQTVGVLCCFTLCCPCMTSLAAAEGKDED